MEGPYVMAPGQTGGPIQFYYYQPGTEAQHRQQAVFAPHPNDRQAGKATAPAYPPPYGMFYSPSQVWQHPPFQPGPYAGHGMVTPTTSPPAGYFAPKIYLDQHTPALQQLETNFVVESRHSPTPPTPSLSACPSTISSPPSSGAFQTPVGGGVFPLTSLEALEGAKEPAQVGQFIDAEWTTDLSECTMRAR